MQAAGEKIFVAFVVVDESGARPHVSEAVVVDPENGIVRDHERVRVVYSFETIHDDECGAWSWCAAALAKHADAVTEVARSCAQKAAAAGIVQVPA